MKTFINKETSIRTADDKGNIVSILNYKDLAIIAINSKSNSQQGYSTDEMRKDFRVLDALDNLKSVNDTIQLEDADFNRLYTKVMSTTNWPIMHKDIVDFEDYIKSINQN